MKLWHRALHVGLRFHWCCIDSLIDSLLLWAIDAWSDFWSICSPFLLPKSIKNQFKTDQKFNDQLDTWRDRPFWDFWSILASIWGSTRGSSNSLLAAFWLLRPSWAQDGAQNPPRQPLGFDFGPFWTPRDGCKTLRGTISELKARWGSVSAALIYIYIYICMSVCLYVCMSVCLYVCISVCV